VPASCSASTTTVSRWGFYINSAGNNRGFTYNIHTRSFKGVLIPGQIAGFYVTSGSETRVRPRSRWRLDHIVSAAA
jgi:hypothetical protein